MTTSGIKEVTFYEEEGLTRMFVNYLSGALDHFGFTSDDRDISYRQKYDYSGPLKYMRPYTRREKITLFYIGATNFFLGLQVVAWGLMLAIGVAGPVLGVWSFTAFGNFFGIALMVDFMLVFMLWIMQLARLDPKYPDAFLLAPEGEQQAHRALTDIWKRNDLRAALAFETNRA